MKTIVLPYCGRTIPVQCIEHTDSICFINHIYDFVSCGPLKPRYFIIRSQVATEHLTAEY